MNKFSVFGIIILLAFVSCNKQESIVISEPSGEVEVTSDKIENESEKTYPESFSLSELQNISNLKDLKYDEVIDPIFWNNSMQEGVYINLFSKKDVNQIIKFREFIESLATLHGKEPVYEYNPVILAIKSYPKMLTPLFEKRPDLFLHGSTEYGNYTIAPIIYVLRNSYLENLKFFFDNNIDWEKSYEMYGSRNAGGSEYFLGGSLLTDAENLETIDYLVSKGFSKEKEISDYDIYICKEIINLYENPSFNSKVINQLSAEVKISGIVITLYKSENYQWIKLQTQDGITGWAPLDLSISYNTGI